MQRYWPVFCTVQPCRAELSGKIEAGISWDQSAELTLFMFVLTDCQPGDRAGHAVSQGQEDGHCRVSSTVTGTVFSCKLIPTFSEFH